MVFQLFFELYIASLAMSLLSLGHKKYGKRLPKRKKKLWSCAWDDDKISFLPFLFPFSSILIFLDLSSRDG